MARWLRTRPRHDSRHPLRRTRFMGHMEERLPTRPGEVLNLRDLEQGIEQTKRVASQDVDMKIEPTDVPDESNVVLTVKRIKPWSLVASVDNSGSRAAGKLQGNLSLGATTCLA